jgi:hypothetical protein
MMIQGSTTENRIDLQFCSSKAQWLFVTPAYDHSALHPESQTSITQAAPDTNLADPYGFDIGSSTAANL